MTEICRPAWWRRLVGFAAGLMGIQVTYRAPWGAFGRTGPWKLNLGQDEF